MPDNAVPDPTPELAAEVEEALTNGAFPDAELEHALVLTRLGMFAVGADEILRVQSDLLSDIIREEAARLGITAALSVLFDDLALDRLRDWLVAASEALQEYLKVHGLPRLSLPNIVLDCGHVRTWQLEAG